MEKKTNTKALTGIFAFCLGSMPSNMTLGLIAYIMQSYSTVSTTTVAMIMTMPSLVAMIYAFFDRQSEYEDLREEPADLRPDLPGNLRGNLLFPRRKGSHLCTARRCRSRRLWTGLQ